MTDESYIQLAIEIAKRGMGSVSPNPLVGCIIIKDNRIIGAGYHAEFGGKHAEVNAIESATENIEGATLYVNLEPCSHYGKTPPCADRIIESRIKKVVIGTRDMNPLVSGNGIKKLKSAGIEVKVGVLEKECMELNKFFFKHVTKKLPYITLKIAQTLDGKIADDTGESKWITSVPSRRYVHDLRAKYDAVLVGAGTVKKDNPNLTVRLVEGRNPRRIVLDTKLSIKTDHKIFTGNTDKKLIVITSRKSAAKKNKIRKLVSYGVQIIFVNENADGETDLKSAMRELGKNNIASILVEGGSRVFTSFLNCNMFDDMLVFTAPKILGDGLSAIGNIGVESIRKSYKLQVNDVKRTGDDILMEFSK